MVYRVPPTYLTRPTFFFLDLIGPSLPTPASADVSLVLRVSRNRLPYQSIRLKWSRVGSGGCSARHCGQKNPSTRMGPPGPPQFQHWGELLPASDAALQLSGFLPSTPVGHNPHTRGKAPVLPPHIWLAAYFAAVTCVGGERERAADYTSAVNWLES